MLNLTVCLCVCVCVYIHTYIHTYKVAWFQIVNAHYIHEIKQERKCNFGNRELSLYFACDYSLPFSISLSHIQIRIELFSDILAINSMNSIDLVVVLALLVLLILLLFLFLFFFIVVFFFLYDTTVQCGPSPL